MKELVDAPSGDPKLAELRKLLDGGDFDAVEGAWMDLLEGDSLNGERVDGLLAAADELMLQGYSGKAGPLLELLSGAAEGVAGLDPALFVRLSDLLVRAFPRNPEYLSLFVDRFQEHFGPTSVERAYFNAAEINDVSDPLRALERFDSLMRFQPGTVVFHESGWGMGEVLSVDPLLGQVRVDLEEKKDHRIAIEAIDSILQVFPNETFRAMLFRGGDALRALAAENAVAVVEKVLDDFGNPLPQKDIKARLVPDVIEAKGWTKWWNAAKKALRETGFYRIGDRSPYPVEKLESQLSFEDDLLERFARAEAGGSGWKETRLVARQVLKGGEKAFPNAFNEVSMEIFRRTKMEDDPARALEMASLLRRARGDEDSIALLRETLSRFPASETAAAFTALPTGEDLAGLLAETKIAREEDWTMVARSAFMGRTDSVRAAACAFLEKEDAEMVRALCTEICASPRRSPETYCWLVERRLKDKDQGRICLEPLAQRKSRGLFILLFDLLEHVNDKEVREGRNAVKDFYRRLEGLMYFDKGEFFREAIKMMNADSRRAVHQGLVRNQENLQKISTKLLEILGSVAPVLVEEDAIPAWKDENIIFSTEAGFEKRQEELRELHEEKLPAIFEAIGKAAEFGDLSENAEYTSALEERDNLVRKAEQVEADLEKVKIIDSTMPQPGVVGIGSRVSARNLETGDEATYSVLGPWDGLPADGVLNYRSPLAQFFIGRGEGDEFEVELPGGTSQYKILSIGSHFD